jgi:hypothetical protein
MRIFDFKAAKAIGVSPTTSNAHAEHCMDVCSEMTLYQ